ncbi:esterase [Metasolibacillus sp. FSL H7-0170]|uniref:alpha/beta hydrolase n=1 Tax=Metasolibacillus sp. FSL H7-0170 TaxID=2921431 RepID=UPI00315857F1
MKSPYIFTHIAPKETGEKPAIFLLHGLGSNEQDLLQLVENMPFDCHIFSLRGPITHPPGYAFYTFEEEGLPNQDVFDQVVQFTKQFIEEAVVEFSLKKEALYLMGFNQGAALVQALTVIMGDTLHGAVVLSGFVPQFVVEEYRKLPLGNVKMFIAHGEYDYVYPLAWGKASAEFFEEYGAQITFKTYADGHGVIAEELNDLMAWFSEVSK